MNNSDDEPLKAEELDEFKGDKNDAFASPKKVNAISLWSFTSFRFRIALALAMALSIEGLMRSNINMAMVCMVNKTAIEMAKKSNNNNNIQLLASSNFIPTKIANNISIINISDTAAAKNAKQFLEISTATTTTTTKKMPIINNGEKCGNSSSFLHSGNSKKSKYENGELLISKKDQSLIFTSFYLGGLAIVLPGGYLCDFLGAKRLVFYGAILNVIGSISTPFIARHFKTWALITVRFLMGAGQGILVPCMNVLITHWFPLGEKSTAIAIATTGNQISVIVAMFLTAELCQFSWLGGWASSFYLYGLFGIILCIIWILYVFDSPNKAHNIRKNEQLLIENCEHKINLKINPNENPFKKILSSGAVWSTALCSFSQNFMNVGIVVYLPTYYHGFLKMNISSNGIMSALPFVIQLLTKILFAGMADYWVKRKIMTHNAIVKIFNLLASFGSGICFILLSFCDCSKPYLAIILATIAVGLSSGYIPGYNTSIVCIAPRYTSSVASFSRLLGQLASVISPYMIGLMVANGTKIEWQLTYWIMAIVLILPGIFFQIFGSASVQEWAKIPMVLTKNNTTIAIPPSLIGEKEDDENDNNNDDDDAMAFLSDGKAAI